MRAFGPQRQRRVDGLFGVERIWRDAAASLAPVAAVLVDERVAALLRVVGLPRVRDAAPGVAVRRLRPARVQNSAPSLAAHWSGPSKREDAAGSSPPSVC